MCLIEMLLFQLFIESFENKSYHNYFLYIYEISVESNLLPVNNMSIPHVKLGKS